MSALLFPGQGSQVVGMGTEFYKEFKIVKKIFNQADEKLNFSISKLILEGPSDELQLTKNTQPAILTVSYSIFKVIEKETNFDLKSAKFYAGHSLGEYSALCCSQSINFELLSEYKQSPRASYNGLREGAIFSFKPPEPVLDSKISLIV